MPQQPTGSPPVCYAVFVAVSDGRHKLLEVVSAFVFAEYQPLWVDVRELVCYVAGQAATCMRDKLAAASEGYCPQTDACR